MKLLYVLFLCLGVQVSPCIGTLPPMPKDQEPTDQASISLQKFETLIMVTCIAELIVLMASDATQQKILNQLAPHNLVKNFVKEYASHATITLLHELGHSIATRLLTDQCTTIYLGSYEKKKPFIDLGPIKIDGFNPMAGLTLPTTTSSSENTDTPNPATAPEEQWQTNSEDQMFKDDKPLSKRQRLQEAAYLLSGGCTAIACHYAIKIVLTWLKQCLSTNNRSLLTASATALTIDPIFIEQLITMLLPCKITNGTLSDGGKLWKNCLGINPDIVKTVSSNRFVVTSADVIHIATDTALLYKTTEGQRPPAIDLLLVAILNHKLRGYLRFTA